MKIENQIIQVNHQPSGGKEYVAKIEGQDQKYIFKRRFLPIANKKWSSSGKTGVSYFVLTEDGIYEVNEPYTKEKTYLLKENNEIKEITFEDVLQRVQN
jgi:hypothetical protein